MGFYLEEEPPGCLTEGGTYNDWRMGGGDSAEADADELRCTWG